MKRFICLVFCVVLTIVHCASATAEGISPASYGYIDNNGNIVISPRFDYAVDFSNGLAKVFSGTLNKYGNPDTGHYGFINSKGEQVIPFIYDTAGDFTENGTVYVSRDGKYGVIDTNGNTVIDFNYDYIRNIKGNRYLAFIGDLTRGILAMDGVFRVLDDKGGEVFSVYAHSFYAFSENYYEVIDSNGKWALFSPDGTNLTGFVFESLRNETDSSLAYLDDGKYGFLDNKGNILIEAQYEDIPSDLINGHAIVKHNGNYRLIDEKGSILQTYKADYVSGLDFTGNSTIAFEGSLTESGYPENGQYYLMNLDGAYLSRGYKNASFYKLPNDYWSVNEGKNWYVLDREGTEIYGTECDYMSRINEERLVIEKNGLCALIDYQGNMITDYLFNEIDPAKEGLILVLMADSATQTNSNLESSHVSMNNNTESKATSQVDEANSDTILVPASLISSFYKDGTSLSEMIASESARSLTTICAFLDYCEYNDNPDVLTDQTYIGKDKNGEILWIGLGGENSSVVLMYCPGNDLDHYSAVPVQFNGSWIPSFIDLYCDPLYQNSKEDIETTFERLSNLIQ